MNQHQAAPDFSNFNERIANAVGAHRKKINLLTGAALIFGFLALVACIVIVAAYFVLYQPKQMQLLRDVTIAAQAAKTTPTSSENPPQRKLDFPSVQATMTHVLSFGTMLVAIAVGLSAAGTLVMLGLVILQRRATLHQINANLIQISNQLRQLELRQGGE